MVCINYSGKLAGVLVYFTFTFNLRLMVLWSALELPTCLMSKMFDAKRTLKMLLLPPAFDAALIAGSLRRTQIAVYHCNVNCAFFVKALGKDTTLSLPGYETSTGFCIFISSLCGVSNWCDFACLSHNFIFSQKSSVP